MVTKRRYPGLLGALLLALALQPEPPPTTAPPPRRRGQPFRIRDPRGDTVYESSNPPTDCRPREYGDLCGGCDECCAQQAPGGFTVEALP